MRNSRKPNIFLKFDALAASIKIMIKESLIYTLLLSIPCFLESIKEKEKEKELTR